MSRLIVVFGFILAAFLSKAQPAKGLVAKYTFNHGSLIDEISGNKAKAYGMSQVEDRFGNSQFACFLNGNYSSFINLGTSSNLKPGKGTVSIWVKIDHEMPNGNGVEVNPIILTRSRSNEDHNEAYFIGYDYNTDNIGCCVSITELQTESIYTGTVTLRQWHHIVITYNDTFFCLYLDGVLENRINKNFKTVFLESDSVLVGNRSSEKNNRFLNGCIDDIEIYNKVLSPIEVVKLYNTPNPNKSKIILDWLLICLGTIVSVLFIIWLIKRRINKLVNIEKEKNELRNHWYGQENRVLTAQMDPHFIFNSLNTIQQFIIINDNEKAQLYLSKFSRLLRMILESNVKDSISLQEEIEIITRYLEIESLRFNNVFKYVISMEKIIDLKTIKIPRFLIQPFIENAIWHGLLPKDGEKQLTISFEYVDDKTLSCIIEDNGVGRKESNEKEKEEKNKSLAINFIRQRLQLMTKLYHSNYGILIIDKFDPSGKSEGTKVIATIPILNT